MENQKFDFNAIRAQTQSENKKVEHLIDSTDINVEVLEKEIKENAQEKQKLIEKYVDEYYERRKAETTEPPSPYKRYDLDGDEVITKNPNVWEIRKSVQRDQLIKELQERIN